jgi:hypothetical protein
VALEVIDVSDPAPFGVCRFQEVSPRFADLNYATCWGDRGLRIIDIREPSSELVGGYSRFMGTLPWLEIALTSPPGRRSLDLNNPAAPKLRAHTPRRLKRWTWRSKANMLRRLQRQSLCARF